MDGVSQKATRERTYRKGRVLQTMAHYIQEHEGSLQMKLSCGGEAWSCGARFGAHQSGQRAAIAEERLLFPETFLERLKDGRGESPA